MSELGSYHDPRMPIPPRPVVPSMPSILSRLAFLEMSRNNLAEEMAKLVQRIEEMEKCVGIESMERKQNDA